MSDIAAWICRSVLHAAVFTMGLWFGLTIGVPPAWVHGHLTEILILSGLIYMLGYQSAARR